MNNLAQAIEYAKSGEKARAKQLLTEIVQSEPNNEQAWLWMSSVVEDTGQQISCLERVLKINPNNPHAAAGLSKLKSQTQQNIEPKNVPEVNSVQPNKAGFFPDIAKWSNGFARWAILDKFVETAKPDPKLGILIAESQIAANRIFGWAGLFLVLAILSGILVFSDPSEFSFFAVIAFIFLGAALYRTFTWYLNKDLQVQIFRSGFTLRKNGKLQTVLWTEVDYVKERWQKTVYQGIIHIKTHKIEVFRTNGETLELNRAFDRVEEIGHLIQLAVADYLLPIAVDKLQNNGTCDFGTFTMNQAGITHKEKDFLPWNQIHALNVHKVGQTVIQIQKINNNKRGATWASENGGTLKNQHLFLSLVYWFIYATNRKDGLAEADTKETGDIHYPLLLTKKEAKEGLQKIFHIGMPFEEKRLLVKVPADVQSGTIYRFPDFGRPINNGNGASGILNIEVLVEKVTSAQQRWQEFQLIGGGIALMFGMMWLGFWSDLGLFRTILYALLIGGLCGWTMSIGRRFIGAFSGAIGGLTCVALQILYYVFMYLKFGRESFWDLESVLIVFIAALPGIGLYMLLKKLFTKKQELI